MQNQSNCLITFDTQLKSALIKKYVMFIMSGARDKEKLVVQW